MVDPDAERPGAYRPTTEVMARVSTVLVSEVLSRENTGFYVLT